MTFPLIVKRSGNPLLHAPPVTKPQSEVLHRLQWKSTLCEVRALDVLHEAGELKNVSLLVEVEVLERSAPIRSDSRKREVRTEARDKVLDAFCEASG